MPSPKAPVPRQGEATFTPAQWAALRAQLLHRSQRRCEGCGVAEHARGARDVAGQWWAEQGLKQLSAAEQTDLFGPKLRIIRIVLTVRPKPQPTGGAPADRYHLLCQRCYHVQERGQNVRKRRLTMQAEKEQRQRAKGLAPLWGNEE